MTPTTWLLVLGAAWIGVGVVLAAVLGRRGFDSFSWFLIGMVLGPMSILVAWNCVRRDEALGTRIVATPAPGRTAAGVDVLVGYDGSPESHAAIAEVVELFGDRLGRVALATVVPFDEAPDRDVLAQQSLEAAATGLVGLGPTLEIIHGHAADALSAAAIDGGYHLLAIGTTGSGHAHLFGSTAKQLANHSTVPVLLTGQHVGVRPTAGGVAACRPA